MKLKMSKFQKKNVGTHSNWHHRPLGFVVPPDASPMPTKLQKRLQTEKQQNLENEK
jgi:hypothetical protein